MSVGPGKNDGWARVAAGGAVEMHLDFRCVSGRAREGWLADQM